MSDLHDNATVGHRIEGDEVTDLDETDIASATAVISAIAGKKDNARLAERERKRERVEKSLEK